MSGRPNPDEPCVVVLSKSEGSLVLFALRHLEDEAEAGRVDLNGKSTESAQVRVAEGMSPRV